MQRDNRWADWFAVLIMSAGLFPPEPCAAQITSTWQQPGPGLWNDAGNWSDGVPFSAGDTAVFGPLLPGTDNLVVVTDASTTVGAITFNNPNTIALVAPTLTLNGNGAGARIDVLDGQALLQNGQFILAEDLTLSVATGHSLTVGNPLAPSASLDGPGGLDLTGGGTLSLTLANTYAGATHITQGTVVVRHNNSLGLGTGVDADGTFIETGGVLEIASNSVSLPGEKFTVNGGKLTGDAWKLSGPVVLNDGLITGNGWTLNGPFSASGGALSSSGWVIAGPVTLDGELTARGTGRIDGAVSGPGGLTVDNVATVRVSGNNNYTGQTRVIGSLYVQNDAALGAGTGSVADGTILNADGKLILSAVDLANEMITVNGGAIIGSGSSGGAIILNGGMLSGQINYNGPIDVSSGLISGGFMVNGPITLNGSLTFNALSQQSNGKLAVNGLIEGGGDIHITGTTDDSVDLYGDNSFTGSVAVDAGRLHVQHVNALGDPANHVQVNAGALVLYKDVSQTITIDGGAVHLADPVNSHTNPITLRSGELTGSTEQKYVTYEGDVMLDGPGPKRISGAYGMYFKGEVSGSGPLELGGERLSMQSANTYTGVTYITDGNVGADHAGALGDTASGTIINGGYLSIGVPNISEPIRVERGAAVLATDVHAGPVTLAGGELTTSSFLGGVARTLASPLVIDGAGTLTTNDEDMILDGGITGRGLIQFIHTGDSFILNGPYDFAGEVIFDSSRNLEVNTPMTVQGKTWFDQGTIVANEDVVLAGGLHAINGATLITAPGKTITIDRLNLANVYIDADLVGPTSLTLNQGTGGTLQRLSDQFDGDINILNGVLNVTSGAGLGSTNGATYVRSKQNAVLMLGAGATVADAIYLNNSTGYLGTGGLLTRDGGATVEGAVDLGDTGSYLGNTRGRSSGTPLYLAGPISGGSLTKVGIGTTYITGNTSTYTGQTLVKEGSLHVIDSGSLSTTSGIRIEGPYGLFLIDNSGAQNLPDRLADHIPFELAGGTLALQARASAPTAETIGHVTAHSGHSLIEARPASNSNSILTLTGLSRNPGATVDFASWPGHGREVHIANPPALDDGILGGWATVYGENFATLQSGAVASLTTGVADINAAGPISNARLNAPNLMNADTTINSLWMSNEVNNLDLDGHTLTVESGGILGYSRFGGSSQPVATIDNGQLTGSSDVGELILHGRLQILADVIDPPGGSLGVTAGGGLDAKLNLAGSNSYTGPTVVNTRTRLSFSGLQSVPVNNDVQVMGGEYIVYLDEPGTVKLGQLTLDLNGFVLQSGTQVTIDAQSFDLRSGMLEPNLAGNSAITKTTTGTVVLAGDNSQYSGEIVVNEGVLVPTYRKALGSGPVTVNPGGRLGFASTTHMSATGPIRLNGGELSSVVGSTHLVSDIHVLADSTIHTARINDYGGIAGADIELNGRLIGDANLLVTGSTNGELNISGDTGGFTGHIIVDGAQLLISETSGFIQGLIDVRNGSGLSILTSTVPVHVRLEDSALGIYQPYPNLAPYRLHGDVTFAGDSIISQYNDATYDASITLESGVVLRKRQVGTITFTQDVLVGEDTRVVVHEGKLLFGGTLRPNAPAASLDLISANAVQITGSIDIDGSQSLTITTNGELEPLRLDAAGQTVTGNGTLGNSLILGPGGAMLPGASAGVFTVDGDYTQLTDALLQIELGGGAAGLHDRLVVTGTFDPGGTLELLLIDGFAPTEGDMFDILDFGSAAPGRLFDQVILPQLGPGLAWEVSDLLTTGRVRVVPEPGVGWLVLAFGGWATARRVRRR